MQDPEVVIYGASGYTGKWVAAMLAKRKIPFIAAGRNKQRLQEQLASMPELAGAEYQVAAVEHNEAALTALFKGRKVVHNLVGPFMQLGEPTVRAALAAGCHYIDATGEQDWMLYLQQNYAEQFHARGLVLAPASSSMWNSGALVAELVLETPGIDSLDISYALAGVPSVSSTLSFMRMCCQPQLYLYDNQLVAWPSAEGVQISVPSMHQTLVALPWSGGGESVWYAGDDRVRNCKTVVTFFNQALMGMVIARMTEFKEHYQHLPQAEQEEATNRWALEIAPQGEPPRENYNLHRVMFTVHGRGTLAARSIVLHGVTGYVLTAAIGATLIDSILAQKQKKYGLTSAVHAIGARKLLAELQDEGVLGKPIDLIA